MITNFEIFEDSQTLGINPYHGVVSMVSQTPTPYTGYSLDDGGHDPNEKIPVKRKKKKKKKR